MTIRGFGDHTKSDYVRQVRMFTAFLGASPDFAEPEDLRRYQLHMAKNGAGYATMNIACSALRFFFRECSGATTSASGCRTSAHRMLPVVAPEEVALMPACANLKHRAVLSAAYGCGLRISEIARRSPTSTASA